MESESAEFLFLFADATLSVFGNSSKWVCYGPIPTSSLGRTLTM